MWEMFIGAVIWISLTGIVIVSVIPELLGGGE